MSKRQELWFYFIPVILDVLALISAFVLAYFARFSFSPTALGFGFKIPFPEYIRLLFWLIPLWIIVFASVGLYTTDFKGRFSPEFLRILSGVTVSVVLSLTIIFLTKNTDFSRLLLIYLLISTFIVVLVERLFWRSIMHYLASNGFGRRRVLVIGQTKESNRIKEVFDKFPYLGFKVIETVPLDISGEKLLFKLDKLKINDIIQAEPKLSRDRAELFEELARVRGIDLHFIPDLYEISVAQVDLDTYGGVPLLTVRKTSLNGWGRIYKHIFDLIFSTIFLIILSPLFLVIAILIKLDSRGPVFFRQLRVGRDKDFKIYKFRSMVANAEELKERLVQKNERSGPLFKIKDDPRITRFGRFLRKTRIDELPQLINVFLGQMSLVGPRPHLPEEVAKYKNHHKEVLTIKPGMTGLPQISGASDLDFEEEVTLDTYYIHNWSFWLDLILLVKTCLVVLKGKGAA
jgi:exopolysaccharide biosynthesis polyprenyl glycosylphosphotransferase